MIEFLTLFLGVTGGPQHVAFAVDRNVAAVELRLDGATVGSVESPPWELTVDFGSDPLPGELEGVAFAPDGRELGRVSQFLNVPRPPAEAHILLQQEGNRVQGARVTWESRVGARPLAFQAQLDGNPLEFSDPSFVALANVDTRDLHVLRIELQFSYDVAAQAQLVFGGPYLDSANAELTAFPVVGLKGHVKPQAMAGWFLGEGEPLPVVAVERGFADLVVVRGPGVERAIAELSGTPKTGLGPGMNFTRGVNDAPSATVAERLRWELALPEDLRLRLVLPRSRAGRGNKIAMESFAMSPDITSAQGGLYWALKEKLTLPGLSEQIRVYDALAAAGLQAANANRRRAVLLVLAEDWEDTSSFQAAAVARFLAALNVPLYLWQVAADTPVRLPGATVERIGSFGELKTARRRLNKDLSVQRIVWVEGLHLPNRIDFAPAAAAVPVTSSL